MAAFCLRTLAQTFLTITKSICSPFGLHFVKRSDWLKKFVQRALTNQRRGAIMEANQV